MSNDGRSGYTLVEVVVAMLISAIMVAAIMSVALSAKKGEVKNDRKIVANQATRELAAKLNAYITADPASTIIAGPGSGSNKWSMTSGSIVDTCPDASTNCYALTTGSHTLTGFLPTWFEATPYSARAIYFVSYPQAYSVANGTVPLVNVTVSWTEP
ncbi:MAG: type II secretion system protein [Elusimicrobia bacterium]|nr:type II secretion system protein [Elusimicrobiota bacterium]